VYTGNYAEPVTVNEENGKRNRRKDDARALSMRDAEVNAAAAACAPSRRPRCVSRASGAWVLAACLLVAGSWLTSLALAVSETAESPSRRPSP